MIVRAVRHLAAHAALVTCLLAVHATAAADAAAGAKLAAARCAPCHMSSETIHSMLPLLEGQPKEYFLSQWQAFRERRRTAPVMVNLTAELPDADVNNLAAYYAAQVPPRASAVAGSDAGRGARRKRLTRLRYPRLPVPASGSSARFEMRPVRASTSNLATAPSGSAKST